MRCSSVPAGRRRPRLRRVVALAVVLALAGLVPAFADEMRTWTDSTGKHKVQAKYVSLADGKVTLEGADGKQFEIELTKLSRDDQKHVADLQKAQDNPFKPVADDPFKPKKPPTRGKPAVAEPELATADWSSARVLTLTPAEA